MLRIGEQDEISTISLLRSSDDRFVITADRVWIANRVQQISSLNI